MKNKYRILLPIIFIIVLWKGFATQEALCAELDIPTEEDAGSSCVISFDGNGSDSEISAITVKYGGTYGEIPPITRTNYVFKGWYTFASGGIKVSKDTKVIKPLSHTLYAHWRGMPVEITLDANEGTISKSTIIAYYGSKYINQLPKPTRAGYHFDGWYTAATNGDKITAKSIFDEKSSKTLYAQWTEKGVRAILYAFNDEVYEITVINGKEYGELPTPEKEGFSFGGWFKLSDYTDYNASEIVSTTIVNEIAQVKLYARWYYEN